MARSTYTIIVENNRCHKDCTNYPHCAGSRNRDKRCPDWTRDQPLLHIDTGVFYPGDEYPTVTQLNARD